MTKEKRIKLAQELQALKEKYDQDAKEHGKKSGCRPSSTKGVSMKGGTTT
eukprot:c24801_g1_i2 orf=297-446(-)